MLLQFGRVLQFSLVFSCLVGLGCSSQRPVSTGYYPVRGKVLVNGKPAEFAGVVLNPVGSQTSAGGRTNANGEFQVNTRGFDGAEPGEYLVTISWALPKNPKETELDFGPELLPAKYQDPKKSGLKVTIEAKDNELAPFDLQL